MLLQKLGYSHKIIPVTVFQTVAANLGSMATPVGNPQNLYLYSFYNLSLYDFLAVTLPITLFSMAALSVFSVGFLPAKMPKQNLDCARITSGKSLAVYCLLFVLCLFTVFRIVPFVLTTVITVAVIFLVNRKLLKEIDYMLLLMFVCFFTVSENLGRMDSVSVFLQQLLQWNTRLTAVGASQVISNVPAAVLLSGFTERWELLLTGVNIGGLGTPIASLASLITIKFYMNWPDSKITKFLGYFTAANFIGLAMLLLFVWII